MTTTTPPRWWVRRRTGGLPLHRNPVCRTSDRMQQISAWFWAVVATLAVPAIGLMVVPSIANSWHEPMRPVTAVVEDVTRAPAVATRYAEFNVHPTYAVHVRWTTGPGPARRGSVTMSVPPRRGSDIRLWATRTGDHLATVRPPDVRVVDLIVLILNEAAVICLAGYGAHRLLLWQLDRRRIRDWELELDRVLTPHRPGTGPETSAG